MSEFVEENNDREHKQERDDVADKSMAQRIETVNKSVSHSATLTQGRRPCPQPSRMPLRQFEARGWQLYFSHYGQQQLHRRPRSAARDSRTLSSRSWWPRPAARWRRT